MPFTPPKRVTRATAATSKAAALVEVTSSKPKSTKLAASKSSATFVQVPPSEEKSKSPESIKKVTLKNKVVVPTKVAVRQSTRKATVNVTVSTPTTPKPAEIRVAKKRKVIVDREVETRTTILDSPTSTNETSAMAKLPVRQENTPKYERSSNSNATDVIARAPAVMELKNQNQQITKTPKSKAVVKKVVNSWTPVLDKRKAALKDTFPGRLDWKFQQFGMPVTSTPKGARGEATVVKTDIDTCFGFDESEEDENYSALISPIISSRKTSANQPIQANTKQSKRDDGQVLQANCSNEQVKINPLAKLNCDNQDEKMLEVAEKKVKTRKPYTRQPKRKNPPAASTLYSKKPKTAHQVKYLAPMYEFDDLMSSQQLETSVSVSGTISNPEEEMFIKKTQGDDAGFNALLARYGRCDNEELEFHIDPGKITRTYVSKKKENPVLVPFLPKKSKRARRTTVPRNIMNEANSEEEEEDNEVDSETKKWLEQKNKEFDDVLHVPLVLAKAQSVDKN